MRNILKNSLTQEAMKLTTYGLLAVVVVIHFCSNQIAQISSWPDPDNRLHCICCIRGFPIW